MFCKRLGKYFGTILGYVFFCSSESMNVNKTKRLTKFWNEGVYCIALNIILSETNSMLAKASQGTITILPSTREKKKDILFFEGLDSDPVNLLGDVLGPFYIHGMVQQKYVPKLLLDKKIFW